MIGLTATAYLLYRAWQRSQGNFPNSAAYSPQIGYGGAGLAYTADALSVGSSAAMIASVL